MIREIPFKLTIHSPGPNSVLRSEDLSKFVRFFGGFCVAGLLERGDFKVHPDDLEHIAGALDEMTKTVPQLMEIEVPRA